MTFVWYRKSAPGVSDSSGHQSDRIIEVICVGNLVYLNAKYFILSSIKLYTCRFHDNLCVQTEFKSTDMRSSEKASLSRECLL
eukprot:SAG31_NODE_16597_length_703_cov_0.837748_2_plen_83_part_00